MEADDEDGNKHESAYKEDNSEKGSIPSEREENVQKPIKIFTTDKNPLNIEEMDLNSKPVQLFFRER